MELDVGEHDATENDEAFMGLRLGARRGNWLGRLYLALRLDAEGRVCWNGQRLCHRQSYDIAVIGLSYGFTIRALPLTGGEVAFAMAALGRAHAFIAGWAADTGVLVRCRVECVGVPLVFRVTFPELVMRGALSGPM